MCCGMLHPLVPKPIPEARQHMRWRWAGALPGLSLKLKKTKLPASSTLEPPQSASRRVTAVGQQASVERQPPSVRRMLPRTPSGRVVEKKGNVSFPKDSPGMAEAWQKITDHCFIRQTCAEWYGGSRAHAQCGWSQESSRSGGRDRTWKSNDDDTRAGDGAERERERLRCSDPNGRVVTPARPPDGMGRAGLAKHNTKWEQLHRKSKRGRRKMRVQGHSGDRLHTSTASAINFSSPQPQVPLSPAAFNSCSSDDGCASGTDCCSAMSCSSPPESAPPAARSCCSEDAGAAAEGVPESFSSRVASEACCEGNREAWRGTCTDTCDLPPNSNLRDGNDETINHQAF